MGTKTGQQQGLKTVTYHDSNIIAYTIALGTRNKIVSTRSILRDLSLLFTEEDIFTT